MSFGITRKKKVKTDLSINKNIYYRAGIFFIIIYLLITTSIRLRIISYSFEQIRFFPITIGITFYFIGIISHYKKFRDISFIKQSALGFLIGGVLLIIFLIFF